MQHQYPLGHLWGVVAERTGKKEISFLLRGDKESGKGHQQLGTGCAAFPNTEDLFPAKRKPLYLKEHPWLPREGKDLVCHLCLNKYKWEEIRDVPQNIHPPVKYSSA